MIVGELQSNNLGTGEHPPALDIVGLIGCVTIGRLLLSPVLFGTSFFRWDETIGRRALRDLPQRAIVYVVVILQLNEKFVGTDETLTPIGC